MKISFIGAGRVGTSAAFSVLHSVNTLEEIVLVDIVQDLVEGEALDLTHAAYAMERGDVNIIGTTNPAATKDTDVYVMTAGVARKKGQARRELVETNAKIVRKVAKEMAKASPNAIVITVTNQVDVINYLMWKETGFPREHVIGMSGVLDTARLHSLGYDGFVLGAHGEEMVPTEKIPERAMNELRGMGSEIISRKGATFYGPAVSVNRLVYAIANDLKQPLPCSCVLDGEYGLKGLSIGVPAVIGASGIQEIIEMDLPKEFFDAAKEIKKDIAALGL